MFGVGVFRKDGVCCYGTNTAVEGLTFGKVDGEGVVTMQIDRLDLVEGEYLLDVAVTRATATHTTTTAASTPSPCAPACETRASRGSPTGGGSSTAPGDGA